MPSLHANTHRTSSATAGTWIRTGKRERPGKVAEQAREEDQAEVQGPVAAVDHGHPDPSHDPVACCVGGLLLGQGLVCGFSQCSVGGVQCPRCKPPTTLSIWNQSEFSWQAIGRPLRRTSCSKAAWSRAYVAPDSCPGWQLMTRGQPLRFHLSILGRVKLIVHRAGF